MFSRQDLPGRGLGDFFVSDIVYGDFGLLFEANPDWPERPARGLKFEALMALVEVKNPPEVNDFVPGPPPALAAGRVFLAPRHFYESAESATSAAMASMAR